MLTRLCSGCVTGTDDLDAAIVLRKNKKFPHACFHAQQAGEKALKAVWYYADADPWGHSIRKLIEDLEHDDVTGASALWCYKSSPVDDRALA